MKMPWTSILTILWRYAVATFLLLYTLATVIGYLVFGDEPTPDSPPDGYRAYESRVRLSWSPGYAKPPFHLEVAVDGDFSKPLIKRDVKSTKILLPPLQTGKKYCWRVFERNVAETSCFYTLKPQIKN